MSRKDKEKMLKRLNSKNKGVINSPINPALGQSDPQEFLKAYNDLTAKYKMELTATPVFIPRDDGTWSLVIRLGVAPFDPNPTKIPEEDPELIAN